MNSKRSDEENAFREGLQDNTVKLSGEQGDPRSPLTNLDQQVTNEDEQNIITVEVDDHGMKSKEGEDNPVADQKNPAIVIPGTDKGDDQAGKTKPEQ